MLKDILYVIGKYLTRRHNCYDDKQVNLQLFHTHVLLSI
jgi:hypothetical protein